MVFSVLFVHVVRVVRVVRVDWGLDQALERLLVLVIDVLLVLVVLLTLVVLLGQVVLVFHWLGVRQIAFVTCLLLMMLVHLAQSQPQLWLLLNDFRLL